MDGIDAYVSIETQECIHLTPEQKEEAYCSNEICRHYYGVQNDECHDYHKLAEIIHKDPLDMLKYDLFHHSYSLKNIEKFSTF